MSQALFPDFTLPERDHQGDFERRSFILKGNVALGRYSDKLPDSGMGNQGIERGHRKYKVAFYHSTIVRFLGLEYKVMGAMSQALLCWR